jgi:hypothetical protein
MKVITNHSYKFVCRAQNNLMGSVAFFNFVEEGEFKLK